MTPRPLLDALVTRARRLGYAALERVLWLHLAAQRPETPAWARRTIHGALAYVVFPLDAVPDGLPGGLADDAAVVTAALGAVALYVTDEVRDEATALLDRWFGAAPRAT